MCANEPPTGIYKHLENLRKPREWQVGNHPYNNAGVNIPILLISTTYYLDQNMPLCKQTKFINNSLRANRPDQISRQHFKRQMFKYPIQMECLFFSLIISKSTLQRIV